jgi:hypothetical protein
LIKVILITFIFNIIFGLQAVKADCFAEMYDLRKKIAFEQTFEMHDTLFGTPIQSFGLKDKNDFMAKQLELIGEERVKKIMLPKQTRRLTNQTAQDLREGLNEFVQLDNEPFIRFGVGAMAHSHGMASGLNVKSAGELLVRIGENGRKVIYGIRNKSGYYHPPIDSLRNAIDSLLNEGIQIDN